MSRLAALTNTFDEKTRRAWEKARHTYNEVAMATIKELRVERGWTQEVLAHKAGISFATLSAIENGRRTPYSSTLRAIAGALEIPVEDIDMSSKKEEAHD